LNEPKRHHYVPKVYLRQFTGLEGKLSVTKKPSGDNYNASPDNTGYQNHLNTAFFEDGTRDQSSIEQYFQSVETDYIKNLSEIEKGQVTSEQIDFFVTFAIQQRMRTPRARKQLAEFFLALEKKGIMDTVHDTFGDHERYLLQLAKGGDKKALNQLGMALSGHLAIATGILLENMQFVFLSNLTERPLFSSDNPTIISGLLGNGNSLKATLPLPNIRKVMLLPLSRNQLMFGDTNLKTSNGLVLFTAGNTLRKTAVREMNTLTEINADREIFAPFDTAFKHKRTSIKSRLEDETNSSRIFNGVYSKSFSRVVRNIQDMFSHQ